jgi:hypothetical protein
LDAKISWTRKKDIHTYPDTTPDQRFLLSSVMPYDDSMHWQGRAKAMLARAEQMDDCVAKQVLRRTAESLARAAEQRAKGFSPSPVSRTPRLPADARQFAPRRDRMSALQTRAPNIDIPSFLKRGPRVEEI